MERKTQVLRAMREQETVWRDRAAAGIEANRKGWARVTVKDADGKPVSGARVSLEQKTHDFKFGANCFMLDELETPEKNAAYKARFAELFNLATLPFYWADLEPERGKVRFTEDSPRIYRRPTPDLCVRWCRENGLAPKLHCLNYDQWTPGWVPNDPVSVKTLLDKRMREIGERYADKILPIEVINETLLREVAYDPFTNRHSSLFFREPDIIEWSFEHARKYFPGNELIINEATGWVWDNFQWTRSNYYMQIQRALEHGASIDGIGMQFHAFYHRDSEVEGTCHMYDPARLYAVMDTYAKLGKPLSVTEITVPAYSWNDDDEEIQAEILTNLYRIWFSHPAMEHIIYWNLTDGYAAFAPQGDMTYGENYYHGALLRFDMSPKPAYFALKKLIHEEWHTSFEGVTDEEGGLWVKGFYGDYDAAVNGVSAGSLHIKKGADNAFEVRG